MIRRAYEKPTLVRHAGLHFIAAGGATGPNGNGGNGNGVNGNGTGPA
jgi:hypothetical protein